MQRRSALRLVGVAALACLAGSCDVASRFPTPAAVDATRLARLTRGINLSHWFAQSVASSEHLSSYITASDLETLNTLGFRHVRLNLDPMALFDVDQPARLDPIVLSQLDSALDAILGSGLAVVVDLHPDAEFKRRLADQGTFVSAVTTFWTALSSHLATRDPELLFLEVLNEPLVSDPDHWAHVQTRLVAAMRAGAPLHTLVATGHGWSRIDELLQSTRLNDANVVYNFHFYDPLTFTHQAATWGDPIWPRLGGVPYPSSPQAVEPILARLARDDPARASVLQYGADRWETTKLEKRIGSAAQWAANHNVSLTCNEFGVYRAAAPAEARIAWLHDVRVLLEGFGIGWAMWDYAEGFGLMVNRGGHRMVDSRTLAALGLS